ncbi:hypothetical protein B0T25DRAFT_192176 [Lasiosphaeria hispida]|uniref:Uncharacterized protein n=1 Tax=Lasiosphaeria hispida TaxID=260671 RepID=A0AAJ0HHI2_9PEZI|nr:hypothetical protein B0T25DRAFT_192176 [Lasiosphaeria hispida]
MLQNMVQPPPIQHTILSRLHADRSNPSIKMEPGIVSPLPPPLHGHPSAASPKSRPIPSPHSMSTYYLDMRGPLGIKGGVGPSATTSYGSQRRASQASSNHLSVSLRPQMLTSMAIDPPPPYTASRALTPSIGVQRQPPNPWPCSVCQERS